VKQSKINQNGLEIRLTKSTKKLKQQRLRLKLKRKKKRKKVTKKEEMKKVVTRKLPLRKVEPKRKKRRKPQHGHPRQQSLIWTWITHTSNAMRLFVTNSTKLNSIHS
jgi:hypothetical protein